MKKILAIFCLLISLSAPISLAQTSNPDGIVGNFSFMFKGGFGTGKGENRTFSEHHTLTSYGWNIDRRAAGLEVIYVASEAFSFIFDVSRDWEKNKLPTASAFYREENNISGYDFTFGIRFFGK